MPNVGRKYYHYENYTLIANDYSSVRKDQGLLCAQWLLRRKRTKCGLTDAWGEREPPRGEQAPRGSIIKRLILGLRSFWSPPFQRECCAATRSRANNSIFQVAIWNICFTCYIVNVSKTKNVSCSHVFLMTVFMRFFFLLLLPFRLLFSFSFLPPSLSFPKVYSCFNNALNQLIPLSHNSWFVFGHIFFFFINFYWHT